MNMIFKGDMKPPKYEHGTVIFRDCYRGTINHRKFKENLKEWEYGVIFESPLGLQWISEELVQLYLKGNV